MVFWDAGGGGGDGSERGWVPGVEKARAFLDLRDEHSKRSGDARAGGETGRN